MIYSIYPSHESSSSSTMDGPSGRKITTTTKPSAFSRLFSNNNRKKQTQQRTSSSRIIMVENKHPTQTVICNVRHLPHPGLKSCSSLRSSSSQSTSEVLDGGDLSNPAGDQLVTIKPNTQRYINVMKDQVFLYVLFKRTSIDNDNFMLAKSPERPLDASHEFYVIEKQDFKVGVAKKVNFSYHHGQVHLGDYRPSAALTTKK